MTPTDLYSLIVRDECGAGGRPSTKLYYLRGVPHIAAGINLRDQEISQRAADTATHDKVTDFAAAVQSRWPWTDHLDPVRRAAIISVMYWSGFGWPRMMAYAQKGDWIAAANEVLDPTPPASGGDPIITVDPNRAHRLASMLEDGQWR